RLDRQKGCVPFAGAWSGKPNFVGRRAPEPVVRTPSKRVRPRTCGTHPVKKGASPNLWYAPRQKGCVPEPVVRTPSKRVRPRTCGTHPVKKRIASLGNL